MAAPADVVVLNSDVVVGEGWLDGLRDAAYIDSRVATATALTNHGSLVSVPYRKPVPQLPPEWNLDAASAIVRARSLRLRPRLPTAIGHCIYVRRSALELVGAFDLAFTPGYGEEVDFSQRCVRSGLNHVLADDVLVLHHGGASFSRNGKRNPLQDEHEKIIATRYPYYHDSVRMLEDDVAGPLSRALSVARRALKGLSLVIDGRVLAGPMTGTQLHVLELIAALSRTGQARIRVIIPDAISSYARQALHALPEVERVTRWEAVDSGFDLADVVHRPYQVSNEEDLSFLAQARRAADRHQPGPHRLPQPVVLPGLRLVGGLPPDHPHSARRRGSRHVLLRPRVRRCARRGSRRAGPREHRSHRRRPRAHARAVGADSAARRGTSAGWG